MLKELGCTMINPYLGFHWVAGPSNKMELSVFYQASKVQVSSVEILLSFPGPNNLEEV